MSQDAVNYWDLREVWHEMKWTCFQETLISSHTQPLTSFSTPTSHCCFPCSPFVEGTVAPELVSTATSSGTNRERTSVSERSFYTQEDGNGDQVMVVWPFQVSHQDLLHVLLSVTNKAWHGEMYIRGDKWRQRGRVDPISWRDLRQSHSVQEKGPFTASCQMMGKTSLSACDWGPGLIKQIDYWWVSTQPRAVSHTQTMIIT